MLVLGNDIIDATDAKEEEGYRAILECQPRPRLGQEATVGMADYFSPAFRFSSCVLNNPSFRRCIFQAL